MKILVVEDDPVSQKIMVKLLSSIGECAVADDGAKGLAAFKSALDAGAPYELLTVDIMMPELNGQELLKRIRLYEEEKGVSPDGRAKIVMTTALGDAESVVASFEQGCEAYVTKPLERELLFKELRKIGIDTDRR